MPRWMNEEEYFKWLDKLETYCAYQERTKQDVFQKMNRMKLPESIQQRIIKSLLEDQFLNEERYIKMFINAKINLKRDGLQKIKYALRKKQVDLKLVEGILKDYQNENYVENIRSLVIKKWEILKLKHEPRVSKEKLIRYMLGKGYQYDDFKALIGKL
jgi:regulatory protein